MCSLGIIKRFFFKRYLMRLFFYMIIELLNFLLKLIMKKFCSEFFYIGFGLEILFWVIVELGETVFDSFNCFSIVLC